MDWLDRIARIWPDLVAGFSLLAALCTSIHAVLNKRDSRAATLWLGFIWFLPLLGSILYLALGVNRIRRHALSLPVQSASGKRRVIPRNMGVSKQPEAEHLRMLARIVDHLATRPLTTGNRLQPLVNGDEAFPAMLAAIESATQSISLSTYIFDRDPVGHQFVDALGRAVARSVAVRVLIDDAGARYSWPSITRELRRAGVPVTRFLPMLTPRRLLTINLRNHRKLLVADGRLAFTGGMNIRQGNVLAARTGSPVQDLQFRLEGPVVAQLQETFANDWAFCTHEVLAGGLWFPEPADHGNVIARSITDGPDGDFHKVRWALIAALADAQTSVQIVTPYFLPDPSLISALNLAALRGVRVDIILPAQNNLPFMHWASRAMWWQVLEHGCRVWLTPPPFDHSKLTIVDGHWVLFGSSNWDTRSLRLNFELNVECYGHDFAQQMVSLVRKKILHAREVTLAEVDQRPFLPRLRDAVARLFSPYL
jgi:cardiolipin synthase A/B